MEEINQQIDTIEEIYQTKDFARTLHELNKLSSLKLNKQQTFTVTLKKGIVKMNLGHYDEAQIDMEKALSLGEKNEDRYQQAQALHQLGILAKLLGNYQAAIDYLRDELRRCSSLMPSYYSDLSYNFFEQGDVKMLSGKFEDAEMYFTHAHTFANTEQNYHGVALACQALAILNIRTGRKEAALELLKESYDNFKLSGTEEELNRIQAEIENLKKG